MKDGLLWTQSARKIVHVWVAMFQRIYTKWEHFFWWKTATCCNLLDGEMGKRDKNKLPPPRCHLTNFDWSKCRFLKRMVPSVFTNFPVQSEYILIYHRNSFIASADNVLLETGSISSKLRVSFAGKHQHSLFMRFRSTHTEVTVR